MILGWVQYRTECNLSHLFQRQTRFLREGSEMKAQSVLFSFFSFYPEAERKEEGGQAELQEQGKRVVGQGSAGGSQSLGRALSVEIHIKVGGMVGMLDNLQSNGLGIRKSS